MTVPRAPLPLPTLTLSVSFSSWACVRPHVLLHLLNLAHHSAHTTGLSRLHQNLN
ncbi:MAG UNVERIFIED_CONTAM: hypothetical protein LVT10_16445 [Anaerolineae bacterium]